MADHLWLRGRRAVDRARLRAGLELPPALADVDAHRGLRGPYTAGGTLLRALAHDAFARCPELAARHNTELATAAPELAVSVPTAWATLEWTVGDEQRTRYYSRLHTRNIANGIADFLRSYLASLGDAPRTLFVDNVHHADPTDRELLAVLLRRQDIPQLTLVVGTGLEPVADPPGEVAVSLAEVLPAFARRVDCVVETAPVGDFVLSDGTTDDPAAVEVYSSLPDEERARRHDERCAELYALGEQSLALGAIPFHAVRGSRPEAGVQAVRHALGHCRKVGLYHAAASLALLGRELVDPFTGDWWQFTEAAGASLAVAGRAEEAAVVYESARQVDGLPQRLRLAYGMAMLHVRHLPEERRDLGRARAFMDRAVALAAELDDPGERVFHSVFARNGLALVEMREGRVEEALRLIEEGRVALDRAFGAAEHPLLRSVLRLNRGLLLGMAGRVEEALAEHSANALVDPGFFEHHFHRGVLLRRLGRNEEAVAAFERVVPLSPPFPEVHYNLADAWLELGDVRRALAAFDYVLELDPGHVPALVNRASLRCEVGDSHGAWDDVRAGLALSDQNVHLMCVQGRLLAEGGNPRRASDVVSAALRVDPAFAPGWALRGQVRFETGDFDGALADFDRAVGLADLPEVRFNRAVVFERVGRFGDAAADYRSVLAVVDDADARLRLDYCLKAGGAAAG
ncbi:tetratricopeptide repeat protein [Actinosynnema sp. NPDC023587]|uniref:tetratricopeptide repeat protein n=1 Tax=Actinosynnema sp. NPDC023587 TaxID=3154695 RepID=UPI0033D5D240